MYLDSFRHGHCADQCKTFTLRRCISSTYPRRSISRKHVTRNSRCIQLRQVRRLRKKKRRVPLKKVPAAFLCKTKIPRFSRRNLAVCTTKDGHDEQLLPLWRNILIKSCILEGCRCRWNLRLLYMRKQRPWVLFLIWETVACMLGFLKVEKPWGAKPDSSLVLLMVSSLERGRQDSDQYHNLVETSREWTERYCQATVGLL